VSYGALPHRKPVPLGSDSPSPRGERGPGGEDTHHPTRARGVTAVKVQRARELRREMTPEEDILWQSLRGFRALGYTSRR
jgi:hypothetical protein